MSSETDTVRSPSAKARAVLAICRVSNLPTIWMNVLTAVVLSGVEVFAWPPLLLVASMSAFYCGGMTLNDIFDREVDIRDKPFRPIPSGRLGLGEAWLTALVLFATGLSFLLLAPFPAAFFAGVVLLGLIVVYDRFHKEVAGTVFVMAATRLMVFITTGWAAAGAVDGIVMAAGTAQFAYTLLVTVVARHESTRTQPYVFPVIPTMIAAMSVLDGAILAALVAPGWLAVGVGAALLTRFAQQYVRGD